MIGGASTLMLRHVPIVLSMIINRFFAFFWDIHSNVVVVVGGGSVA